VPEPKPERHVLQRRHVREQAVGLENHADIALVRRESGQILAGDDDPTRIGVFEAGEETQCRRLAATGRPEECHQFTRLNREAQPVQRDNGAVSAG
jgi:hypothetical protein